MKITAALIALVTLGAATADAQPAPWQPARLSAGWTFTPSLVLGGMWDSNVTMRNAGTEVDTIEELVGTVNPRGEIDYNGRHTRFNAGYSGTLLAYRTLSDLNRYDQRGRLELRHQASPRLLLETRHTVTAVPTTEQLDLAGLPFTRVGSQLYGGSATGTIVLSPRASLSGDYSVLRVQFDREAERFALVGGNSHGPRATLKYRLSPRVEVGGTWEYRHTTLEGNSLTADVNRGGGDISYEIGPYTTISGGLGIAHLRLSRFEEPVNGPSYSAGLSHRFGSASAGIHYERSFVPSFSFGSSAAHQALGGSVFVPLMRTRMSLNGNVSYRRSAPLARLGQTLQLDSFWHNVTLGYAWSRWLRTETYYSGVHQNSSMQGNFDRHRIGVQFVTSMPMRIQ